MALFDEGQAQQSSLDESNLLCSKLVIVKTKLSLHSFIESFQAAALNKHLEVETLGMS